MLEYTDWLPDRYETLARLTGLRHLQLDNDNHLPEPALLGQLTGLEALVSRVRLARFGVENGSRWAWTPAK